MTSARNEEMWFSLYRSQDALPSIDADEEFDLIVVGSGNGACGFLSECLKHVTEDFSVLVLEEGDNLFFSSNITHQNEWGKHYHKRSLFKLHNTVTQSGRPILVGRAKTFGGGGSFNYTMIHESSDWLAKQAGRDEAYWDLCKKELNEKFKRPDPLKEGYQTLFANFIADNAQKAGYSPPSRQDMIENIPSVRNSESKKLYFFPSQFDRFGCRTNSGVSLVNWDRVTYRCNTCVLGLIMGNNKTEGNDIACTGVKARNKQGAEVIYKVKATGRVILCGGSQSPRLLLKTKLADSNERIGQRVNDHICMLLGLYLVEDTAPPVGKTDIYESMFAKTVIESDTEDQNDEKTQAEQTVVGIDFFSGQLTHLLFMSNFYLAFLPFNFIKRLMAKYPIIYEVLSRSLRIIVTFFVILIQVLGRALPCFPTSIVVTTSLVKFNASKEGYYERDSDRIILRFFEDERDYDIAEEFINNNLDFLESNGKKLPFLVRFLLQIVTRMPYQKGHQVKRFVRHVARNALVSQQHLAGGCLLGDAVDMGIEDNSKTGLVFGSTNLHVADLSIVPLPRVSTQMTAYLMGHHVAKQLFSVQEKQLIV